MRNKKKLIPEKKKKKQCIQIILNVIFTTRKKIYINRAVNLKGDQPQELHDLKADTNISYQVIPKEFLRQTGRQSQNGRHLEGSVVLNMAHA